MRDFAVEDGLNPETIQLNESSFVKYGLGSEKCFDCDIGLLNGSVISYTLYSLRFSGITRTPILYIEDIYIHAEHRKMGLGRLLMEHIIEVAENRNCSRVELVVDTNNKSARMFYNNFGFQLMENLNVERLSVGSI